MKKLLFGVLGCATVLSAAPASAAVVLVDVYDGTDCGGQGGFENCFAFPGGTQQGSVEGGSPTIFKIGSDGEESFNSLFPSITGDEFDVDYTADGNIWSFTYTQGVDDPIIRYFTVKQGDMFALFTDDGGAAITTATLDLDDYFDSPGWSHATFFDTGTPAIPEPATWAMLLIGFGAVGASMRRRKSALRFRLQQA